MLLTELFTQPTNHRVLFDSSREREARFTIGDKEYYVVLNKLSDRDSILPQHVTWEVGFSLYDPTQTGLHKHRSDITGTGDAAKIFATVLAIVKEAIQEKDIKALKIAGKPSETSRTRLYKRMVNTISKQYGWKTMDAGEYGHSHEHAFYVYKD